MLHTGQEPVDKTSATRKVNFCSKVKVILIPTKQDYITSGIETDLRYSEEEYFIFRQSFITDLDPYVKEILSQTPNIDINKMEAHERSIFITNLAKQAKEKWMHDDYKTSLDNSHN